MGMAMPPPWDDEHTREVKMMYVRYHGTAPSYDYLGPAPSIRVCKACGCSRDLCRCSWRREG
jgi:hypothetical protein